MQWNMKLSSGFSREEQFSQLLTTNVIRLNFKKSILTDDMLQCIGKRCKYLQELLIISGTFQFSQIALENCIDQLENLRILQITGSDVVNNSLVELISRRCKRLQSLWLNNCVNITDGCGDFLQSMKLVDLNLANTNVSNVKTIH